MATGSAKKFVYEIQAEYSGEQSIKRLQADLDKIASIEVMAKARQQLRDAAAEMKSMEAEAARLKDALSKSFDPRIFARLNSETEKLGRMDADFGRQEAKLNRLANRYAELKAARDRAMSAAGSSPTEAEAAKLEKLGAALAKAESAWRRQGERVREASQRMAESRARIEQLNKALAGSRDPALQRQYDAQTQALANQGKTLDDLKKRYREAAAEAKNLGVSAKDSAAQLAALQRSTNKIGRGLAARQTLGIRSDADIQADIARIRRAYETLRQSGTATAAELRRAHQSMSRQIAGLRGESRGLVETASRLQGLRTALAGFAAAFGVSQLAAQARELFAIADRYAALDAKIKLVTKSEEEAARVRERLYSLSQATGTAYADNADAFSKLALSMREAGIDGEETARIIDVVNKTLVINGSSAGMAGAFMLQFSQAMASGVLQGDEFRSMMENNGYFAGRLAKHLNTNIAGLRQMSREGKLTQAVLRDFFKSAGGEEIDRDFEAIPKRVSMAVQAIKNAWEQIVAASDQGSGASARLVESLTGFATYLESNREGIQELLADIMLLITRLAELGLAFGRWVADNGETVAAAAKSAAAIAGIGAAVKTVTGTVAALSATRVALHGLAVSAGSFGTSIAAAGLAMRTGFVGALTASAVAVGKLAHTIYTWRQAEEEVRKSQERGAELRARQAEQLARISAATGVTIKSFQELVQAEKEGKIHFDEATSSWVAGAKKREEASKEVASTVVKVEGEALKALVQEYKKHFDEIIRLQQDITGRQKSLAAELRDLGRTGMSDRDAWADQKLEAEEYVAAAKRAAEEAKRAMASGDTITGAARWKEAVQYADDAKSAYRALNKEIKDGDQVIVSRADALKTAMAGVKEAGELAIDLLKQQQEEAYKAMDALEEQSGFAGLMSHMDEALNKWMEGWRAMQGVGEETVENVTFRIVEQERQIESLESAWLRAWANNRNYTVKVADELKKKLDEATKPRTVKVYVAEVQKRRLGGIIGGDPARYARGGKLPGYGGGDRVSALLEAGEFVIRKEAVRKWGAGFFAALNNLRLPELPDLSALLPPMPKAAAAAPTGSMGSMVLELKLPGGDTVAATVSGDDAERLARWNRRVSNTRFRR